MRKNYKLEVVAGITMPKLFNNKGKKTKKNYIKEFIDLNRDVLKNKYNTARSEFRNISADAEKKWLKSNATLEQFVTNRFPGSRNNKYYISQKAVRYQIKIFFGDDTERYKLHIMDLILGNDGFYQALKLEANEEINANRIAHTGENIYRYVTQDGRAILFKIYDYSDLDIRLYRTGD